MPCQLGERSRSLHAFLPYFDGADFALLSRYLPYLNVTKERQLYTPEFSNFFITAVKKWVRKTFSPAAVVVVFIVLFLILSRVLPYLRVTEIG